MLKKIKEIRWGKVFSTSVLISFILPIAFLIYRIVTSSNEVDLVREYEAISETILSNLKDVTIIFLSSTAHLITGRRFL